MEADEVYSSSGLEVKSSDAREEISIKPKVHQNKRKTSITLPTVIEEYENEGDDIKSMGEGPKEHENKEDEYDMKQFSNTEKVESGDARNEQEKRSGAKKKSDTEVVGNSEVPKKHKKRRSAEKLTRKEISSDDTPKKEKKRKDEKKKKKLATKDISDDDDAPKKEKKSKDEKKKKLTTDEAPKKEKIRKDEKKKLAMEKNSSDDAPKKKEKRKDEKKLTHEKVSSDDVPKKKKKGKDEKKLKTEKISSDDVPKKNKKEKSEKKLMDEDSSDDVRKKKKKRTGEKKKKLSTEEVSRDDVTKKKKKEKVEKKLTEKDSKDAVLKKEKIQKDEKKKVSSDDAPKKKKKKKLTTQKVSSDDVPKKKEKGTGEKKTLTTDEAVTKKQKRESVPKKELSAGTEKYDVAKKPKKRNGDAKKNLSGKQDKLDVTEDLKARRVNVKKLIKRKVEKVVNYLRETNSSFLRQAWEEIRHIGEKTDTLKIKEKGETPLRVPWRKGRPIRPLTRKEKMGWTAETVPQRKISLENERKLIKQTLEDIMITLHERRAWMTVSVEDLLLIEEEKPFQDTEDDEVQAHGFELDQSFFRRLEIIVSDFVSKVRGSQECTEEIPFEVDVEEEISKELKQFGMPDVVLGHRGVRYLRQHDSSFDLKEINVAKTLNEEGEDSSPEPEEKPVDLEPISIPQESSISDIPEEDSSLEPEEKSFDLGSVDIEPVSVPPVSRTPYIPKFLEEIPSSSTSDPVEELKSLYKLSEDLAFEYALEAPSNAPKTLDKKWCHESDWQEASVIFEPLKDFEHQDESSEEYEPFEECDSDEVINCSIIPDEDAKKEVLKKLTKRYAKDVRQRWAFELLRKERRLAEDAKTQEEAEAEESIFTNTSRDLLIRILALFLYTSGFRREEHHMYVRRFQQNYILVEGDDNLFEEPVSPLLEEPMRRTRALCERGFISISEALEMGDFVSEENLPLLGHPYVPLNETAYLTCGSVDEDGEDPRCICAAADEEEERKLNSIRQELLTDAMWGKIVNIVKLVAHLIRQYGFKDNPESRTKPRFPDACRFCSTVCRRPFVKRDICCEETRMLEELRDCWLMTCKGKCVPATWDLDFLIAVHSRIQRDVWQLDVIAKSDVVERKLGTEAAVKYEETASLVMPEIEVQTVELDEVQAAEPDEVQAEEVDDEVQAEESDEMQAEEVDDEVETAESDEEQAAEPGEVPTAELGEVPTAESVENALSESEEA